MAKIPDELNRRLSTARSVRSGRAAAINDYLRFADPTRPRIGDSHTTPTDHAGEADDLFDAVLQEVHEDFTSDLLGRLMPRDRDWVLYAPETTLDEAAQKALAEPLRRRTGAIFAAIRQSDFYVEAATEWAGDLAHGTGALTIIDPGAGQRVHCEAIPPGQLLIERGARGGLSFQARECAMALEEAIAFWPDYDWPAVLRQKASRPNTRRNPVGVIESAERIYTPAEERWRWRVTVDNHLIHERELVGRGSCPIVATRWRTHASSPWGVGPGLKTTPDARSLDQLRYLVLKRLGNAVDPARVYDDDGVMNPEGGVGPGTWLPRLPGSKVDTLEPPERFDLAYFEQANLQDNIRRALYQYGPRQRGKTPPTLGQWMDEKGEEGRRLEHPTGKLYEEGAIAVLDRFERILVDRGEIEPLVGIGKSAVRVRALNPLAREQDFEQVATAQNLLQMGRAAFGDQAMAAMVDGTATMEKLREATNDKLLVMRSPEDADPLLRGVLGQPGVADAQGLEGPAE